MKHTLFICILSTILISVEAMKMHRGKESLSHWEKQKILDSLKARGATVPTEFNATVKIDHYNNEAANATNNNF